MDIGFPVRVTVKVKFYGSRYVRGGVAHLVVHETRALTNSEMILPVPQETSEGVLSTVDTVVQRRDNPRRLRNYEMVFTLYRRLYNWLYNQLYEHSRFWRV